MGRFALTRILLSLAVFGLLALPVVTALPAPGLEVLRLKSIDARFHLRGERPPGGQVVVAAIDAKSIETFGRWPWSRSVFAELAARLNEYGARTLVLDLLLSEPEENPVQPVVQSLMQGFMELELLGEDMGSQIFMDEMQEAVESADNDSLLARTLVRDGNVILAMAFEPGLEEEGFAPYLGKAAYAAFAREDRLPALGLLRAARTLMPLAEFAAGAAGLGYVNVYPDRDGAIRRVNLALGHQGAVFMPLALAAARHYLGEEPVLDGAGAVRLGDRQLPFGRQGSAYLHFYGGSEAFAAYSCADIIQGLVPAAALRDKVVVVGGMTTGLGDIWATPLAREIWGVFLQATLLDNILENRLLREPGQLTWLTLACMLALVMCSLLGASLLPPVWFSAAAAASLLAYAGLCQYLFQVHHLLWPMVLPLGAGLISALVLLICNYVSEGRQRRWIKQSFSHYLSPAVVDMLARHPEQLRLGGEERELTIVFADMRGFTTLAEALSPVELTRFLNMALDDLTEVILANGGTLDKYMGDAIMAFFGAPLPEPLHPEKACRSAIAMCEVLHDKRRQWVAQGLPSLQIGIGLNTGEVVVGNLGSTRRFDYSVIGNQVNVASRLEGLTKVYGVKIIISEQTRERLSGDFVCRELDLVQVKGKSEPVRIFELLGRDYFTGGRYAFVASFERGLAHYRRQEFAAARREFAATLALKPCDKPAQFFLKRCRMLAAAPPGPDWDGIWKYSHK